MGAKNNKIAYALVRVSTSIQTTDSQATDIVKVAEKLGYFVPQEYIFEEKISGLDENYNEDRESIQQLKTAIKIKKPDAIFVWEISRLTRTPDKVEKYISELSLQPMIPMFIYKFGRSGIWTIENGEIQYQNTRAIRAVADAVYEELQQIRARTMRGRNNKALLGKFVGHVADGFLIDKNDDFIVDENRKSDIIRIFELYANHNYATDEVATILNAERIKTTTHYRATSDDFPNYKKEYKRKTKSGEKIIDRTNKEWTGELVSQFLKNEWYRGERYYTIRDDENFDTDRKKVQPQKFDVPLFVPQELLNKVDKKLKKNRIVTHTTSSKHSYLLSGIIFCGKCGKAFYGHHTGLYNHYYCSSAETKKCGNFGVCQENIEAIIIERIKHKAYNDVFLKGNNSAFVNFFNNDDKIKEYENKLEVAQLTKNEILKRINDNKTKIENAVNFQLVASNITTQQVYATAIQNAEKTIEIEEGKLIQQEGVINRYKRLIKQTKEIKQTIKRILSADDITDVKSIIERIDVYSQNKQNHIIKITWVNGVEELILYNPNLLKKAYISLFGDIYAVDSVENKIVFEGELYYQGGAIINDLNKGYEKSINEVRNNKDIKEKDKTILIKELTPQSKIYNKTIEIKELIQFYKTYTPNLVSYYEKEEVKDEKALEQKKHYKELSKSKNKGLPSSLPRLENTKDNEQIKQECKKIYNRIYKIKKNKSLTIEEKEQKIGELKDRLAGYKMMKVYISREEQVRRYKVKQI